MNYSHNGWTKEWGQVTNIWFGYRYLDIDYDTGSGATKLEYDVAMHGPILGASFHF
ncbi:MAG: hypothetical protein JSW66_06205 [Phycisphaerales bacterium]|nr:MAG: hypothetical protein JSW66_06205 [Phycisphaerales bacterium]